MFDSGRCHRIWTSKDADLRAALPKISGVRTQRHASASPPCTIYGGLRGRGWTHAMLRAVRRVAGFPADAGMDRCADSGGRASTRALTR